MTDTYAMPEAEFDQIEDAVQQTPRGRAFLRAHAARNRSIAVEEMQTAFSAIKDAANGGDAESAHLDILRRELQEMSAAILHCRQEIASIKPEDGGNNRIMAATEELDAIVSSTERATTDILSAAEVIQDTTDKLSEGGASADLCDQIQNQTINIMTACSFQDITGQRTTKVVNALRYLEQRVNSMIEIWNAERNKEQSALPPVPDEDDSRPDSHLLNGPQLEGEGVSQDDVDALFADPAAMMSSEAAPKADVSETEVDTVDSDPEELTAPAVMDTINQESTDLEDGFVQSEPESEEETAQNMEPVAAHDVIEAPDAEGDSPTPTVEDLAISEQPLGQDEVAKLLGA